MIYNICNEEELEQEILKIRKNKILAKYLMDTQQKIDFISESEGCRFICLIESKYFASNGGIMTDPISVHPAQLVHL